MRFGIFVGLIQMPGRPLLAIHSTRGMLRRGSSFQTFVVANVAPIYRWRKSGADSIGIPDQQCLNAFDFRHRTPCDPL